MSSLCKHKRTCAEISPTTESAIDNNFLTNLVLEVIKNNNFQNKYIELQNQNNNELQHKYIELQKQNNDFQQKMMESFQEVLKNGIHNTTNSHNKTFNLQFFLNETCKDAMNIMEFVESIKLQLSDLEKVGKVGFVNGISNIIVNNLKALDENQRPVHCTDKKREVIYVKDEDKWEKEDVEYKKIRKAIKCIARKNSKLLFEFKEKYPDCLNGESKCSDKYTKLVIEAYGGKNQEDVDNENKIIKNISKTIAVNKNNG
jgi:disulfide oxidoreductase YuzD